MRTYETSCEGKVRFRTRARAKHVRRRLPRDGHLTVYLCDFCGFHHIGHLPPAVASGRLAKSEWLGQSLVEPPECEHDPAIGFDLDEVIDMTGQVVARWCRNCRQEIVDEETAP